jgi:CRISPR-associated protein Cmr1
MTSADTYTLKALTDIWTGSVRLEERNGQLRERIVPDRLITTGLLGSIRWWFEVLVRGLGGSACDPTQDGIRCPEDRRQKPTDPEHCVVCELFGRTGWARKFRFQVLDEDGKVKQDQIKKDETVKLVFTELRPIRPEEWALLDLTLRLIADYGAIGGKTPAKNADFGLIKMVPAAQLEGSAGRHELKRYVLHHRWRRTKSDDFGWASLRNFWFVEGRFLRRRQFDHLLQLDEWLAGSRGVSKKVFSFKEPEEACRTFGFVEPGTVDFCAIKNRLKNAWTDLRDDEFIPGEQILERLLSRRG